MANFFDQFDVETGGSQQPSYADAIAGIESRGSGNYRAVGPATRSGDRALGRYQVMSRNIRPWSREIMGREVTPSEFMSDPNLQDQIFEGKFGQYVQKYGPEGAARAWFAGEEGMNHPNRRDSLGTSVADYSRKFTGAIGFSGQPQRRTDLPPMIANGQSAPSAPQSAPGGSNFFDQFDEAPAPQAATPSTSGRPRVVIDTNKIGQPPEAQATGAAADRGALDAGARGVAQGLTANFGDEIRGLIEASGANPDDPASVYSLISGALKYFGGDAEAKKAYEDAVARERGLNTTAEQQHPVASTVGGIAGAMALPLGVAAQGATLPARMGLGAATGAAIGGASGAGEGTTPLDRTSRAITGVGVGGALGGVAPAAIEGIVRGGRAIATPIANAVRGVRDVDSEAARRVVGALQRDQGIDPGAVGRLTPNEFAASVQSGGPANIMDLGGETTRALARSAANTSPEGRAVLNRAINDRFEGQTSRVTEWLNKNFNYPDASDLKNALRQAAKNANRPAYERVMAAHPVVNVPSEITDRPAVAQAMKDAVSLAKNYGEKLQGPTELRTIISGPGFHIADDVPMPAKTSLRYWDYVKKALDARIEGAKRKGGIEDLNSKQKADFRGLVDSRNALVDHLDDVAPGYKQARAGAAAYFGAQDAVDAGRKILTLKMNNGEIAKGLSMMTPGERKLAQDGFVSEFVAMLRETGDRRNVLNKIADSPAARQRLNIILGPQKSAEFEATLRVEGIMDLARNAVQGNSTTARQLAELGLAGGTYGISTGGNVLSPSPSALLNAAIVYGAARGKGAINERLSRRVAEMLASNDPRIILQGIRTVARNQNLFNSLRAADRGLARVGGEQAPSSILPAVSVGRAEDQPNEPRPPGQ